MFLHTVSAASCVQKPVNTSRGTLDRNTLFYAEFLTGWQESLKRNKRRFIGKKKRRQLILYEKWEQKKKKMVLVKGVLVDLQTKHRHFRSILLNKLHLSDAFLNRMI